jgi:hypothetical protein
MGDYASDRRLFAVMGSAGWLHDPATGGFTRGADWVSWGQAEDALRLADEGETVVGVAPQSRVVARVAHPVANDSGPGVSRVAVRSALAEHKLTGGE